MSGTGLYLGDPAAPAAVQARGLAATAAPAADVLGAVAGSAWQESIGPRIFDWAARQLDEGGATLDAEEANRRYGIPGVLTFNRPVAETTAAALRADKEAEQRRQAIVARRAGGLATSGAARTAVAFATAVLDPVNVAAAFIPVVGEARLGAMLASAGGAAGRAGVRAGVGAVEGAVGMAALEPVSALLSRSEHADWTMGQALENIAFGTILGGSLHVLGGAAKDAWRGRSAVTAAMQAAGPEVREAALRGAVAAVAEGRPVAVQPLLDLPTVPSYRPVAGAAPDGAYAAFTPGGLRIDARAEVVDLGSLIPSHTADGAVNPLYPHAEGLQPRDRGTAGSQDQVRAIAANLEPTRLAPSPEAGAGAPIIDARGVVESGNGRVAALELAYSDPALAHRAAAYRAFLEAQGYDLTGIDRPVLVGRRITDLPPDQAAAFARGANERPNLAMTAPEQARADAGRAANALDQLAPGGLTSPANRDFVRAFLAQMPAEERGGLIRADGSLSAAGETRIRQAMLAHAYGDGLGPLLEKFLAGDVDALRGLAGALADTAGPWGQMRRAAAQGAIPADMDITRALGEAVQTLAAARAAGRPLREWLAQADAFAAPPDAATLALLRLIHRDDALTRLLPRDDIAGLLARYTGEAGKAVPGPDMFGTPPPAPADILRAVQRHVDPEAQALRALDSLADTPMARPEDVQASRAAQEALQAAREPAATGVAPPHAQAAQRAAQAADDALAELTALPLSEAERAQVAALREGATLAEAEARAAEQAALCIIGARR